MEAYNLDLIARSGPFLIAGPCALESEAVCREVAAVLCDIARDLQIPVIFKGSYSKANRTHEEAFHGLGLERGLELLALVRREFGLPVTSDVHEIREVAPAGEVLDLVQIPSLLCKNTGLLHAAADTGKPVNIKKGQFITAADMRWSVDKVTARGNRRVWITERGNLFGYGETVVDFRVLNAIRDFAGPVIFDATHSVRHAARRSADPEGGTPQDIPLLARCAAAAGFDGLFLEVHPRPGQAPCDAAVAWPLADLPELARCFVEIRRFVGAVSGAPERR
ncbi:MAG: 3-deoxy-8-phosphooctulonate synthase [Candidatus Zixiibacteriota bacterium]|nr:MAG: 3-deoxy-8-phosphooctulonate synthase [candidate division Zixibacteria bacterium]